MSTWDAWMGTTRPSAEKAVPVDEDALARMADRLFTANMSSTKWRTIALRLVTKFRERERVWNERCAEAQTDLKVVRKGLEKARHDLRQLQDDYKALQAKKNPPKKVKPKPKTPEQVMDSILDAARKGEKT